VQSGKRRERIWTKSAMAAPRGEVTIPIRRGSAAADACARGEQALGGQLPLELLERQLQRAHALRLERLHLQLVIARAS